MFLVKSLTHSKPPTSGSFQKILVILLLFFFSLGPKENKKHMEQNQLS